MTLPSPAPRVAAVVLNFNQEHHTVPCVESLLASDYPALTVVLVDNGSPDGSGERLHRRFPELPYVQTGANLGYTGGNNRGIERALAEGAEYVVVMNNDTLLAADCIRRLVETAVAHPDAGCVGPKIYFHAEPTRIWFGGGRFDRVKALGLHDRENEVDHGGPDHDALEETTFVTGCCMLFPARALREAGSFAEDYFIYGEDVELSVRLRARGWRLLYQPAAVMWHKVPLTQATNGTPFQIRLRDRNRRRLVRAYYGLRDRLLFAAWFYPTRMVHLARYAAQGDRARMRAIVQGIVER